MCGAKGCANGAVAKAAMMISASMLKARVSDSAAGRYVSWSGSLVEEQFSRGVRDDDQSKVSKSRHA